MKEKADQTFSILIKSELRAIDDFYEDLFDYNVNQNDISNLLSRDIISLVMQAWYFFPFLLPLALYTI